MYLTAEAVLASVAALRAEVHPFIGITYLACKRYGLSVGATDTLSLDTLTREHMDEHHRIDRRSAFYFQPFRGSAAWWVVERYPSTGLQTVNTQTFASAFIHPRGTRQWGFQPSYVEIVRGLLEEKRFASQVPADALAVWLLKDDDLSDVTDCEDLVKRFFDLYNISEAEQRTIFSQRGLGALTQLFSSDPLEMSAVIKDLPPPPDADAEGGRTIASMRLVGTGPADEMSIEFGQQLTIVTGDNGLGKSFLLDFAWWAATGQWADREALPPIGKSRIAPLAEYSLTDSSGRLAKFTTAFDRDKFAWVRPTNAMTVEALAVFSRADGSFAIADPIRSKFNQRSSVGGSLSAYEVWNGRPGLIEGLIRDWVRWQASADRRIFDQFAAVLKRLSPEDLGTLLPGDPVRLPGDPRDIPTIKHRYDTVPVTHASSGVQRVLLLAYLIIWSWQEHELAAEGLGRSPLRRMMVVVDELEAHLHPKWQRIVLPALMSVGDLLSSDLAMQTIAATHSPMVLASLETLFDPDTDFLYHLYGVDAEVRLEQTPFIKYGDASGWLTSPLFGLRHARSREAEFAIEAAKALQAAETPQPQAVSDVSERLKQHLASDDKFWPRWLFFAEQHGVQI